MLNTWIKMSRSLETVHQQIRGSYEEAGLTESQFGVLEMLLHLGPLHQRDLARKHLVTGGNMTLVVNNLERDGHVERRVDPQDRRANLVDLTPAGRQLIERVFRNHLAKLMEAFAVLDAQEQGALEVLCRKLGKRTNE